MATFDFTSKLSKLALSGAGAIILGTLIFETYVDDKEDRKMGMIGFAIFIAGWIMISIAVSMDKNLTTSTITYEQHGLYALIVMFCTVVSMAPVIIKSCPLKWNMYWQFISVAAWIVFAVVIGYKDVTVFGSFFDYDKFYIAIAGAACINLSMYFLGMYRKFRFSSISHTKVMKEVRVYNPGLVLYTVGWLLIVMAIIRE